MKEVISISVEDKSGVIKTVEIPTDMGLNLMEALKANEYDIEATCGGMALCATCHIRVVEGLENLLTQGDAELDMLETLPFVYQNSRLSCQIQVNEQLDGLKIKIIG
jgi:ferredoxin